MPKLLPDDTLNAPYTNDRDAPKLRKNVSEPVMSDTTSDGSELAPKTPATSWTGVPGDEKADVMT
jgi:hypothetical protein